ncbi:MAG: ATP-binding protein [Salinivirgaceae bacterium]|jgi:predicted AAA+ superfamily ATPase|nr:ATP-binding protein [Salinivirgaceae bacterium]
MKRKITDDLLQWKENPKRMPLIVNGARQVGKTFILKEFAKKHYSDFVYVNLETNASVNTYFDGDIEPVKIIQYLETVTNARIIAGETLIILDEIQSCARALLSLKNFCEEAPQYHIVAAGSLLGVAIHREKYSFPVGKVDELSMFPLDFEEFLWACNKDILCSVIQEHYIKCSPLPKALHKQSIDHFQMYIIVGGMPAAIVEFIDSQSYFSVADIQGKILNEYIADMAKYADNATSVKIRGCYNSIPTQLAKENKKFQYKIVQKGGTASIFGESIDWLYFAGIALKCQKIDHGFIPISAYTDFSGFKLYMGDVGLLTLKSGMPHQMILSSIEQDNGFMGAIAENYVAQALHCNFLPLYYWKNNNTAELDFVLQLQEQVIPIEVKKGKHTKAISMHLFQKKYNSPYAIRISLKNFGFENTVKSIPLYAVFCIKA